MVPKNLAMNPAAITKKTQWPVNKKRTNESFPKLCNLSSYLSCCNLNQVSIMTVFIKKPCFYCEKFKYIATYLNCELSYFVST